MQTFIYQRHKLSPPLIDNPFKVISLTFTIALRGFISIVKTGIKINKNDDYKIDVFKSLRSDLIILDASLDENNEICLSVVSREEASIIQPTQEMALLHLCKRDLGEHIRFSELDQGRRKIFGDAQKPT